MFHSYNRSVRTHTLPPLSSSTSSYSSYIPPPPLVSSSSAVVTAVASPPPYRQTGPGYACSPLIYLNCRVPSGMWYQTIRAGIVGELSCYLSARNSVSGIFVASLPVKPAHRFTTFCLLSSSMVRASTIKPR